MKCNFFGGRGWIRTIEAKYATDLHALPPLATRNSPYSINGAGGRIRTPDLLITNQLLYQLSYTSVEIGLPASYPLYAPKRRIMALKYNIQFLRPLSSPFFTGRRKTFTGARYAPFLLLFLPRGSKIKEEEKRRADAARHTTEQRK